jgi:peptidylprolyl isomerase/FKBP-type peptidyl-prolyl cis-trans isomerase FklB
MRPLAIALLALLAIAACQRREGGLLGATTNIAPAAASGEAGASLTDNARQPGVVSLPSGLQYKITRRGPATGLHPREGDEVKVNYEGRLVTGEVFDSTYQRGAPVSMPVAGLVPGMVQALALMRPGDEWTIWIPPTLGYGDRSPGPIPTNSVLIFRLELIDVLPAPERIGRG